jgi:hypothetical protein
MSAIFFALSSEAKPWIEALGAKPAPRQGHFRFYHSEKHTIVITGPGKLAMAMAVTELAMKLPRSDRHPGYRVWNLGICGSTNKNHAIGSFFWCNKIEDWTRQKYFYPERLEKFEVTSEAQITTFDRPISIYDKADPGFFEILSKDQLKSISLVDMESAGFFEAASIYFDMSLIQVGKVVSDHLNGEMCTVEHVFDLMTNTVSSLLADFELESPYPNLDVLSKAEWNDCRQLAEEYHFTESMLVDLRKSVIYFKIRHLPESTTIPVPIKKESLRAFEKRDAKEIFLQWKSLLHV